MSPNQHEENWCLEFMMNPSIVVAYTIFWANYYIIYCMHSNYYVVLLRDTYIVIM